MNRLALALFVLSCVSSIAQEEEQKPTPRLIMLPGGLPPEVAREVQVLFAKRLPTREEIDRRFEEQSVYKGTFLDLLSEDNKEIFLDVAVEFLRENPCPEKRLDEFRFCLTSDNISVVAWCGAVRSISRQANGKHLIVMTVRPDLVVRGGGVAFTPQMCTEHWEWDGHKLTFIKLERNPKLPAAIFID